MLEQEDIQRVIIVNADVLSRKTSPKDRNSYPLIGDAAAITVVEHDTGDSVIYANLKMDGTRNNVLMIPGRWVSTAQFAGNRPIGGCG